MDYSSGAAVTAADLQKSLDTAMAKLQAGDSLGAEETVHAAVQTTASQAGTDSPLYARALFNEATILATIGDLNRATTACRAAALIPARDGNSQRDRLTYLINLGEMLTRMGEFDEAEEALRVNVDARREFYGPNHPGYAFGLSALAGILSARGQYQEALRCMDEAIVIHQQAGHERLARDLGLRAFIVKALGPDAAAFSNWTQWTPQIRDQLIRYCLGRAQDTENAKTAPSALAVLTELRQRLHATPNTDSVLLMNVLIGIANVARLTKRHDVRIEASQRVIALGEKRGDKRFLVQAYQGLAHALSECGRLTEADAAYQAALTHAGQVGDQALAANVLRNHAIMLDEQGQSSQADALHRQAVASAAASGDAIMHGRTLGAYGIFLQHAGSAPKARSLLEQAATLLPPSDPDAYYIQCHRDALQRGDSCGCDQGEGALAALVHRLIQQRLPGGLVKGVKVTLHGDQPPDIGVELIRQPTETESEQLHRVVSQALAEMRRQYRTAGYSR